MRSLKLFAAILAVVAAVEATTRSAPVPLASVLNLGGADGVQITTLAGSAPRMADVEIALDRRRALILSAPGRWAVHAAVPREASLRFALDVQDAAGPLSIRLQQRGASGTRTLHEERAQPARGWTERKVDLADLAGQTMILELSLEGGPGTVAIAHPDLVGRGDGERPNIILYVIDCLRADHVGAYGYPRPTTPEIDRLARDGVVFENVQACASWTKPAVGCLLTSLYPVRHGAQTVEDVLDPANPTLAETLRGAGYATAAWVANPFVSANPFGLTRGFDRVVQTVDKPAKVNINDLDVDAADITRAVLPWLRENADRRFFLYLHSLDLHAEYRRRPPFDRMFVRRDRHGEARQVDLYDNELAYNDHEVGRLLEALKREGLYDRTMVVVTADHGEEFGEHGFTRHGHTLFQALLHVPLVVKLPGSARRGARVGDVAGSIDVAPTLLGLAGVPAPPGFQGVSLVPALDGRPSPARPVFSEQLSPKEVLYAARDGRFKYIHQLLPSPDEMLFDLETDPAESRNLLPDAADAVQGLVQEAGRFMQLGQRGYHLSVSSADPAARVRIEASTPGGFEDIQRFPTAPGETLTLSPDRMRLDYAFGAGSTIHHVVLRTSPAGADVRLAISVGGRPLAPEAIALGPDAAHPEGVPFVARAEPLRVGLDQATDLLKATGAGVRLWYIPAPAPDRRAPIDPDLEQKLRALGYIQ